MARRRKRRKKFKIIEGVAKSDHQINPIERDRQLEFERLERPASDYPPIVHELLAKLPHANHKEALEISLQLQKYLRGPAALLNNPEMHENVAKLRERAANLDEEAARFEENRGRFVDEVFSRSEKIKPTGEKAEKIKAKGLKMAKEAIKDARDLSGAKQRYLDLLVETGPREKIWVAPRMVRVKVGDVTKEIPQPVIINVGHRKYELKAGEQTVPVIVAEEYRKRQRQILELQRRKEAYAAGNELGLVEKEMKKIDREFGTRHEIHPRLGGR